MASRARLFLSEFLRSPRAVGAVLPSSDGLAEAMVAPIDFATARDIVEFGPGTGSFTARIAARLTPRHRYIGIESNEQFCRHLALEFPALRFVNTGAERVAEVLAENGMAAADAIVSGLPWASLPIELQDAIFAQMGRCLHAGSVFVTFAYLQGLCLPGAWALRRRLQREFSQVTRTPVIWTNMPPAFTYACRK
jgi:phosphatidylethanolamine/phosphatidyl-N-methylethanolamine N-methyltransferase